MIDEFDYKEPLCPLSGGRDFYDPKPDDPLGHVPVERVIEKLDTLFAKNDYVAAGRLLLYWRGEAVSLRDRRGELAIENELVGYYRKQGEREPGLASVARSLALLEELEQGDMASGATILINCATAYNAFDMPGEAMPLYRRAAGVYHKVLTPGDSRFAALYNNMALTLVDLGRFDEAEAAYLDALSILEGSQGGDAEAAITYVNLAHMYDTWRRPEKIVDCMANAYTCLKSERIPHDGYYAFVLEKCAPSFGHFGDSVVAEELKGESERIYAGN